MIQITVDKISDTPLYIQIRDALQAAIQSGDLQPGEKIPPVMEFAKQVGVTHATIRRALEDLIKAGQITSHVGRGTFVSEPDVSGNPPPHKPSSSRTVRAKSNDPEAATAAQRFRSGIARSLEDLMILARRPGLIQFTSGIADPLLVPDGILGALAHDALKGDQKIYYGCTDYLGLPELRAEIARRYAQQGISVSPDQILITNGSQQAITAMSLLTLEHQMRLICETPCYMGLINVFRGHRHSIETMVRDTDGPLPEQLERFADGTPSVLYLCPELHNPMGTDMSVERRRMLADWARTQQAIILSDEIFHDLHFDNAPFPSLLTEIGEQYTVALGSLSKTFMGGLRVGWLVSSPERVRALADIKWAIDIVCPPLMQGIALSLFRTGEYDAHLSKARQHYRRRRDAALQALQRFMPKGVSWTIPQGGFQMWLELPEGYSSIALFLLAIERGVAFIPGPLQDVNHRFINALRLCYGSVEPEHITEGIELLADAVNELLKRPAGESGLSGLGNFQ